MLARFSRRASSASDAASGDASGAASGAPGAASRAPDEPAVPRSTKARPWLLLAPILLFLAILGAAALVVLRMSFGTQGNEWRGFTLQNYADLLDGYFLKSLWLTLKLAFQSMVCAVLLAIPVALAMARTKSRLARRLSARGRAAAAARQSAAARLWLADHSRAGRSAQSRAAWQRPRRNVR